MGTRAMHFQLAAVHALVPTLKQTAQIEPCMHACPQASLMPPSVVAFTGSVPFSMISMVVPCMPTLVPRRCAEGGLHWQLPNFGLFLLPLMWATATVAVTLAL